MHPDPYIVRATKRNPWISLESGRIFIMGRSIPDKPDVLFDPVKNWISDYCRTSEEKTRIDIGFEYINTASTKWLYMILRETLKVKPVITWYYEQDDDAMKELGSIFSSLLEYPVAVTVTEKLDQSFYENILFGKR